MNDTMLENSPLGKDTQYDDAYNPNLLYHIPRATNRNDLGLTNQLPFSGGDLWNAYEFSWLNAKGKPQVAILEIYIPAGSRNIVESKSLKLYLNSFSSTRFSSKAKVLDHVVSDLSEVIESPVSVNMKDTIFKTDFTIARLPGECIDDIDVEIDSYQYNPQELRTEKYFVAETLVSHLLKSICPVTGQPDWASVIIDYHGPKICRAGLLKYIISYRTHHEFHEQCIERMFVDITRHCYPTHLTVYARYTRRGGIDINPFRSNFQTLYPNWRLARQ